MWINNLSRNMLFFMLFVTIVPTCMPSCKLNQIKVRRTGQVLTQSFFRVIIKIHKYVK